MRNLRSILGLSVLCALAVCAFAAGNASAAQRAFTCSSTAPTKTFSDAHCNTGGGSNFGHVEIANGVATSITMTNAKTAAGTSAAEPWTLEATIAGLEVAIECTGMTGTGSLTNAAASVTGTGVLDFTGCIVESPPGHGCTISGGTIISQELRGTTVGQAAGKLKVEPAVGTLLANITIDNCDIPPLNNTFSLTGSVVADVSGATATTTTAGVTAQNTLRFGGVNAGLKSATTINMSGGGEAITLT